MIAGGGRRRARFHLAHRFDVLGLTERAAESMAIIAWALGWLPLLQQRASDGAGGGLSSILERPPLAPGSQHRRLAAADLCEVPGERRVGLTSSTQAYCPCRY